MSLAYFADDGNYGDATGMVVLPVDSFDSHDWEQIDRASDDERVETALAIYAWKNAPYPTASA